MVLRTAVVILWRHWPVLFALSFAALAARAFVTYGAVRLSHLNGVLGLLVFILVPLATLTALMLMMRVLRASLPAISQRPMTPMRSTFDIGGSVLIPFLAVYASYGYLQADRSAYAYATWISNPTGPVTIPYRWSVLLVVVIVVALSARAVLSRWAWAQSRAWLGFVRTYLEIIWIAVAASVISPLQAAAFAWLSDRRVAHGSVTVADHLGQAGAPARHSLDWIGGLLSSAETVIAVPVAWLAVGAIVYGQTIDADGRTRNATLVRTLARRWVRLPKLVRRAIVSIRSGADERFGPLAEGLRVVRRAGLVPMLLFCLLFLVTQSAGTWLFMCERWLIGPRNLAYFWMPLSSLLSVVNDGIGWVLLVCLLAAAADRVIGMQANAAISRPTQTIDATVETAALSADDLSALEAVTQQLHIPAQRVPSSDPVRAG